MSKKKEEEFFTAEDVISKITEITPDSGQMAADDYRLFYHPLQDCVNNLILCSRRRGHRDGLLFFCLPNSFQKHKTVENSFQKHKTVWKAKTNLLLRQTQDKLCGACLVLFTMLCGEIFRGSPGYLRLKIIMPIPMQESKRYVFVFELLRDITIESNKQTP